MADFYSVNTTKLNAGASGDNIITGGQVKVTKKIWYDSYEAAGVNIGETIELCRLSDDQTIINIKVYHDALGGGSTLEIGDSDTSDRYIAAASTAAVGSLLLDDIDGVGYVTGTNTGDDRILATVGGGAVTGTIKIVVTYTN